MQPKPRLCLPRTRKCWLRFLSLVSLGSIRIIFYLLLDNCYRFKLSKKDRRILILFKILQETMEFLCLFIRTVNNILYKSWEVLLQTWPEFVKLYKKIKQTQEKEAASDRRDKIKPLFLKQRSPHRGIARVHHSNNSYPHFRNTQFPNTNCSLRVGVSEETKWGDTW